MSSSLGKAFQRSKQARQRQSKRAYQNLVEAERDAAIECERRQWVGPDDRRKGNLKSIWETNALEDFLDIADRREEGYFAERDVRVVIDGKVHVVQNDKVVPHGEADGVISHRDWLALSEQLPIPRRPEWTYSMSAEEIQAGEKAAFTDWRRTLAQMEEKHKVVMTPYEKNLEVWRQLWRVVERADVVAVILDARNPLIFRSKDFESYVAQTKDAEGNAKKVILLLNKADLLTENQRKAWAQYFQERGDIFYFFSARPLTEEEDATAARAADDGEDDDSDAEEPQLTKEEEEAVLAKITRNKKQKSRHRKKTLRAPVEVANAYELAEQRKAFKEEQHAPKVKEEKPLTEEEVARNERLADIGPIEPWSVLDAEQLLDQLATYRAGCGITSDEEPIMVGLVGYPNVGKSSTINAIIGSKKVVVSATPGKTKHFQTLEIPNERRVGLCDCPGLVFPSFASTKEQMVCDGILPVDTVTDGLRSSAVICRRLPREVLERRLRVSLLPEDDVDDSHSLAERLLNALARKRGYMASHNRPNRTRAAKDVLKLYVDGHLLYVEPPPTFRPDPSTELSIEHFLEARRRQALEARPVREGDAYGSDDDIEEVDDWDTEEDEAWAELDDAADERALSDYGDDDRDIDDDDDEMAVVPPMFFARPVGVRSRFTRQEFFNLEGNLSRMEKQEETRRRKKRTNHQLEPDMYTFVNREGEVELRIDDDDGVLELVDTAGRPARPTIKNKPLTQKQQRRMAKKVGGNVPMNPSAKRMAVNDY